jgi:hypothetical protein
MALVTTSTSVRRDEKAIDQAADLGQAHTFSERGGTTHIREQHGEPDFRPANRGGLQANPAKERVQH